MGKLRIKGNFGIEKENIKQLYSDKSVKLLLNFSDNCVEIQRKAERRNKIIFFDDLRLVHCLGDELIIVSENNQREVINIHSETERDSLADAFTQFIYRVQGIDTEETCVRYYWTLLHNLKHADDKCVCMEMLLQYESTEHVLSKAEIEEYNLYLAFFECYLGGRLLCILTDVEKKIAGNGNMRNEFVKLYNDTSTEFEFALLMNVYEAYACHVCLFYSMSDWVQKENADEMKNQIVQEFNGACEKLFTAIETNEICELYGECFDSATAIKWQDREKFAIAYKIGSIFEMDKLACDMSKANLWYDVALDTECAIDLPEYAEIAYFKANKAYGMCQEERKEWLQSAANKGHECAAYELSELLESNGEKEAAEYWKKIAVSGGVTSAESAKKIQFERNKAKTQNLERNIRNWDGAIEAFSQTVETVAGTVRTVAETVGTVAGLWKQ